MSRYEPEIGGNVSLFADEGSQTDVMEIGQVKRLGKRSLELIQRLNKLVRQLGDLREQSLRSFEDYTITRVADIYETYERRLAFAKDRHEKRTKALDDHYEVQLEDYLNRAGGDWVLQFLGDYEKDIADIKESFLPAIKRADDLVHKLQARADANEEVIRTLSTKALRLENDAHKKGYSMADIDMVDADAGDEDAAAASDRRKAVSEMLEIANVAGAYTGRTVTENDITTTGGHRSSKLEMDAVMMNAALSQTQKDLLLTRNGASRFNAVRPPRVNVRAELSRFLDYCRAKQELLIDNIKARKRDEMEQVAKQCYESMLEVEAQLRDYQKNLLDTIKRSEEEEELLVKNADKHRMLAEIKARRQRAALTRLTQEQDVLKQLVPRIKRTGPERSPNKQESEGEDSSDESTIWVGDGLSRELSYAALGRRHGRVPSVSAHGGSQAGSAGSTGGTQVSNVIRSLRRHLAGSRKGGSRAGSMMSRASSKYLDVAMLESLSNQPSPIQSPGAQARGGGNWRSRALLPDINPEGSSSPTQEDDEDGQDDVDGHALRPHGSSSGVGGSRHHLDPQSSDVASEGMRSRGPSGHLSLIQKLNSQVEAEDGGGGTGTGDAADTSLHDGHKLGSSRHVRSSILALVGIEDDSSSVSSVHDTPSHADSRRSTELSEETLARQIEAALQDNDGFTDGGSVFVDSEAGDAYHAEEGNT